MTNDSTDGTQVVSEEVKMTTEEMMKAAEQRLQEKLKKGINLMKRVMIYGPPVDRKKKDALQYMREWYLEEHGAPIEVEQFLFECPTSWVFLWDPANKRFDRAYLGKVL